MTGHFGSWEIAPTVTVSEGVLQTSIFQPLHNRFLNEYVVQTRTRRGEKVARIGFGMKVAIRALRKGETVGI